MDRVHYMSETVSGGLDGPSYRLIEPGYPDKAAAKKAARDLEPGTYWLVTFDSPTPVTVEPPPKAVRNVAKFGSPFIQREKGPRKANSGKAKGKGKSAPAEASA